MATAFTWHPDANDTYDSQYGTQTVPGSGEAFNKDDNLKFTMNAPGQTLTLDVTGGSTTWGDGDYEAPIAPPTMEIVNGEFIYQYKAQAESSPAFLAKSDITLSNSSSFQIDIQNKTDVFLGSPGNRQTTGTTVTLNDESSFSVNTPAVCVLIGTFNLLSNPQAPGVPTSARVAIGAAGGAKIEQWRLFISGTAHFSLAAPGSQFNINSALHHSIQLNDGTPTVEFLPPEGNPQDPPFDFTKSPSTYPKGFFIFDTNSQGEIKFHGTGYSLFQFGAFVDYGFFHVRGPDGTINEQPKNMVYPHYDAANKILTVSRMP